MNSRRRTRAGGGRSSDGSTTESVGAESSLLEESFVGLDPNDLLQMLGGDDNEEELAEQGRKEEEDDEGEERDIVTALDGKFLGAIAPPEKRKRSQGEIFAPLSVAAAAAAAAASASVAREASVTGSAAAASAPGGRIRTVLRVRPVGAEAGPLSLTVNKGSSATVTTLRPATQTRGSLSETFACDRVMDASAVQEDVYPETAAPLVAKLFEGPGESAQLFAYGATGSGKSHTLWGPRDEGVDSGVIPRVLEDVFQRLAALAGGGGGDGNETPRLGLRALEIYKDKAFDLLPTDGEKPRPVRVIQTHDQVVYEGLEEHWPASPAEALGLTKKVRSRVRVKPTLLNPESSRSHTVLMLRLNQGSSGGNRNGERGASLPARGRNRGRSTTAASDSATAVAAAATTDGPVLYLVDLAGSERLGRSQSDRVEALNINLDISDLFNKFKEMENGAGSVVCRTRTLTCVLKRMFVRPAACSSSSTTFGANCVMIVAVNPAVSEYGETQKVLSNTQLSSRVVPVKAPVPLSAVGSQAQIEYGMNGHLLKRQKTSHPSGAPDRTTATAAVGCSAVRATRKGKGKAEATAAASAASSSGRLVSRYAQALEMAKMRERVTHLEGECARLQHERVRLEEEHEEKLERVESETFRLAADERHEAEQELESEVADLRGVIRQLKEELESKSPVGKAVRAVVAQSERKQAALRAESIRRLERATTREADDEAARQSQARARAEESLAAARALLSEQKVLAEKEATRADLAEASAARLRDGRSAERSARAGLEAEVERLKAAAKAEAESRADAEKKLKTAEEEITRLENERKVAPASAAAVLADVGGGESGGGSDGAQSFAVDGTSVEDESDSTRRDSSTASGADGLFERGDSVEEEEEEHEEVRSEASTVDMIDDRGNEDSFECRDYEEGESGSAEGEQRQQRSEPEAAALAAASPAPACNASGEDVEGRDTATDDESRDKDRESPEILPKKRTRRRLGQAEAERKPSRTAGQCLGKNRQPLRNLLNRDDDKENVPSGEVGKGVPAKSVDGSKNKEAGKVLSEADSNDSAGEGEERPTRKRGGARGKRKKAGQGNAAGDNETQRYKALRNNARRRSPEVWEMTEKQAKNLDVGIKIVKERLRPRRGR